MPVCDLNNWRKRPCMPCMCMFPRYCEKLENALCFECAKGKIHFCRVESKKAKDEAALAAKKAEEESLATKKFQEEDYSCRYEATVAYVSPPCSYKSALASKKPEGEAASAKKSTGEEAAPAKSKAENEAAAAKKDTEEAALVAKKLEEAAALAAKQETEKEAVATEASAKIKTERNVEMEAPFDAKVKAEEQAALVPKTAPTAVSIAEQDAPATKLAEVPAKEGVAAVKHEAKEEALAAKKLTNTSCGGSFSAPEVTTLVTKGKEDQQIPATQKHGESQDDSELREAEMLRTLPHAEKHQVAIDEEGWGYEATVTLVSPPSSLFSKQRALKIRAGDHTQYEQAHGCKDGSAVDAENAELPSDKITLVHEDFDSHVRSSVEQKGMKYQVSTSSTKAEIIPESVLVDACAKDAVHRDLDIAQHGGYVCYKSALIAKKAEEAVLAARKAEKEAVAKEAVDKAAEEIAAEKAAKIGQEEESALLHKSRAVSHTPSASMCKPGEGTNGLDVANNKYMATCLAELNGKVALYVLCFMGAQPKNAVPRDFNNNDMDKPIFPGFASLLVEPLSADCVNESKLGFPADTILQMNQFDPGGTSLFMEHYQLDVVLTHYDKNTMYVSTHDVSTRETLQEVAMAKQLELNVESHSLEECKEKLSNNQVALVYYGQFDPGIRDSIGLNESSGTLPTEYKQIGVYKDSTFKKLKYTSLVMRSDTFRSRGHSESLEQTQTPGLEELERLEIGPQLSGEQRRASVQLIGGTSWCMHGRGAEEKLKEVTKKLKQ